MHHITFPSKSKKVVAKIPAWFIVFILAFAGAMIGIILGSRSLHAELDSSSNKDIDPTAVTPDIEVIYSDGTLKPKQNEDNNLQIFGLEKGKRTKILVFITPDAATRKSANLRVTINGKDKYTTCSDAEKALRPEAKCYPISYHSLTSDLSLYTVTAENNAGKAKARFYAQIVASRTEDEFVRIEAEEEVNEENLAQ